MTWAVVATYGPEANAIWRKKHPKDRRIGPRPGEVAFEVRGPKSVAFMDAEVARSRPDIGEVRVFEVAASRPWWLGG